MMRSQRHRPHGGYSWRAYRVDGFVEVRRTEELRSLCKPRLYLIENAGVPTVLRHEHWKRAIVRHAAAHDDLDSPISEAMLNRVLKMQRAGQLTSDQARRTVEYHSKGLALPSDVMHAIVGK